MVSKRCDICGVTTTSKWRTLPTGKPSCNACGVKVLYPNRSGSTKSAPKKAGKETGGPSKAASSSKADKTRAASVSEPASNILNEGVPSAERREPTEDELLQIEEHMIHTVVYFVKDAQKGYSIGRKEAVRRLLLCLEEIEEQHEPHVLTTIYRKLLARVGRDGVVDYDQRLVDWSSDVLELHVLLTCGMMVKTGDMERVV